MPLQPTQQQQKVVDAFHTGKDVIISAGAGCGKSSTLEMVARSTKKQGLLISFNRSVADEAANKLRGTSTKALNTHRIAYAWARRDANGSNVLDKMETTRRVRKDQIARSFNVRGFNFRTQNTQIVLRPTDVVTVATQTLDNFMKDGSTEISVKHVPMLESLAALGDEGYEGQKALAAICVNTANKMWEDIISQNGNSMRVTHDAYLKLWAMNKPELPYDFILLDEAQDTNPAVFSVFEAQQAQKISVGDACQQLFAWNGSLNIMEKFEADIKVNLTQSWRFGTAIQDAANVFLEKLNADIRLQGNPRVNSIIAEDAAFDPHKSAATLVRTNAGAIQELIYALEARQSCYLVGGNTAFISLVEGAQKLKEGRQSNHPDFLGFESWSDVRNYAEEASDGGDLKVIVNLVDRHGTRALLDALNRCVDNERDAQTVISTVHKVKGREWDQVRLASDFETSARNNRNEERGISREDLMLYYVAVTRAKELLDPGPLARYLNTSSIDFSGNNGVQEIKTALDSHLALDFDDELLSELKQRFANQEDLRTFVMGLVSEHVSDMPQLSLGE